MACALALARGHRRDTCDGDAAVAASGKGAHLVCDSIIQAGCWQFAAKQSGKGQRTRGWTAISIYARNERRFWRRGLRFVAADGTNPNPIPEPYNPNPNPNPNPGPNPNPNPNPRTRVDGLWIVAGGGTEEQRIGAASRGGATGPAASAQGRETEVQIVCGSHVRGLAQCVSRGAGGCEGAD